MTRGGRGRSVDRVWYAAYGSNLSLARFTCYLTGGVPPGGTTAHPGCRDPSPPRRSVPVLLPGQVHFTGHAEQWGGAVAFLDPAAPGTSPARAYDLAGDQLADVVAQEGRRPPPGALDVAEVVAAGRWVAHDGWYGTVVHVGHLDDVPLLTFTSPWGIDDVSLAAPSARYLRLLAEGLAESHGWGLDRAVPHLLGCPGVTLGWDAASLLQALAGR